jgi:YVTN family beta-propeller protein
VTEQQECSQATPVTRCPGESQEKIAAARLTALYGVIGHKSRAARAPRPARQPDVAGARRPKRPPATNQIYVANEGSNNVTVIDGATNVTATVSAGANPYAVAVWLF